MSDEQLTNHLLTILLLELGGKQFSNFFCIFFQVPNKLVSRHCTGEGFPCGFPFAAPVGNDTYSNTSGVVRPCRQPGASPSPHLRPW